MPNRTTYIYALLHPVTNEVRYIGKTINIKERYSSHCKESNNKKNYASCWIRSIRPLKPEILTIEEVKENWIETEQFWIAYFKSLGANLTNLTNGGEGIYGHKHTEESRLKMSISKLKMSNETKLKMSASATGNSNAKGYVHSDEAKIKMSASAKLHKNNLGKKHSDEGKAKMSEKLKGRPAWNKGISTKIIPDFIDIEW